MAVASLVLAIVSAVGYLILALWLGIYVLIATADESAMLLLVR